MPDVSGAATPEEQFFETSGESPAPPIEELGPPPAEKPDDQPPEEKAPKMVPLGALHEERERRKELQREAQATTERAARMEARFDEVMRRMQGPAKVEPQVPDINTDPVGHLKAEADRNRAEMEEFKAWRASQGQQTDQARQQAEFVQQYAAKAREFAEKQPDFQAAYTHLWADRNAELNDLGFADPAERQKIIAAEEQGIALRAFRDNVNPAERLYAISKRRGFKGSAETGAAKIETLRAGTQASRSIAGGGVPEQNIGLEAVSKMSDTEFDKYWDRVVAGGR